MAKVYITKEEQLEYENESLKGQLWREHEKLFVMLKACHERYINSEPKYLDISYTRYKTIGDIVAKLELSDECESFLKFIDGEERKYLK